jgi:hypothetical protein
MSTLLSRLPFAFAVRPRQAPARAQGLEAHARAPAPPSSRELELEEIRGAALRRMFPKLFSWHADRWARSVAVEAHCYLAGATSVEDLEQRIRNVERKRRLSS